MDDLRVSNSDPLRDGPLLQPLAAVSQRVGLLRAEDAGVTAFGVAGQGSRDEWVDPHPTPGCDPDDVGQRLARRVLRHGAGGTGRQAGRQQHVLRDGRVDDYGFLVVLAEPTDCCGA